MDNFSSWNKIDLGSYRQSVEDQRNAIALNLVQPMDGKMTVVIEDKAGIRVRNLVTGASASSGKQRIIWDGCDEDGNLVVPGTYTWRSIHHPGITAEYLRMYANGRDKGLRLLPPTTGGFAMRVNDKLFFSGTALGGRYAVISYNAEGEWVYGYNFPHGTPHGAAVIAADETYLYAVNAGADTSKDQANARHNPDWAGPHFATLTRINITSGRVVQFPEKGQFHRIFEYEASRRDPLGLNGLALRGDRLYVGYRPAGGVLVFDKNTGVQVDRIEVPEVGAVAVSGDSLLAISGPCVEPVYSNSVNWKGSTSGARSAGLAADTEGNLCYR